MGSARFRMTGILYRLPRGACDATRFFRPRRDRMCVVRLASVPLLQLWRLHGLRCLGVCVFFHSIGMVGEQVVLGWYILEITDSAFMVGVALGVRNLPLLFAGIPAGVVADRGDRVRLLRISGVTMAVAAALLGALVAAGLGGVGPALMLTFFTGCARALHQTARQGYAHDIAGGRSVVHALALVALTSRLGGLLGSLMTGFLIARFGSAAAFLLVAAGYLVSAVAMLPARSSSRPREATAGSVRDDVFGFLRTIRRDRVLLHLMSLTAIAEVLGFSHQALLPSLARDVLRVGPEGLGVMTAARQVGGLAGIAFTSGLGGARGYGPLFLSVLIAFGASLVALGFAPSFPVVLLVLVAANALGAVTDVLAQTLIQLAVPSGLRGRAGGAWVVSIGMAPLGQFQVGALASLFGVGAALGVNGLALMAVGAAAALLVPRLRRL
ncbi:MAG: hypothetical protein DME01_18470 [Candidatus Rokuibacteriota bacterium]|nr:MAG: hypothetical protein DME01_18470 [Candidatus Rokubacteria bacterium]